MMLELLITWKTMWRPWMWDLHGDIFHFVQSKGDHVLVSYDGKVKQIHDILCVIRITKNIKFVGAIINMMMSYGFWHDQYCWVVNSPDPIKNSVKG